MENILYKQFDLKADVEKREFTAIISTNDVDLANEVLLPEGVNAKDFKNNAIILFNHDRDNPIGTAKSIRRQGNGLVAKGKLAQGIERIDDIWKLVQQGILKGVSVGFQILEQRPATPEDIKMFGKNVRSVISKWKLLEFSIVSIPCNQSALITGCKELDIDHMNILGDAYVEETVVIKDMEVIEEEIAEKTEDIIEEIVETEEDVKEQLEEEIKELDLDIEIEKGTKDKIIEVVKENKVDMREVIKYFAEELKKEIKKNKGNLF